MLVITSTAQRHKQDANSSSLSLLYDLFELQNMFSQGNIEYVRLTSIHVLQLCKVLKHEQGYINKPGEEGATHKYEGAKEVLQICKFMERQLRYY